MFNYKNEGNQSNYKVYLFTFNPDLHIIHGYAILLTGLVFLVRYVIFLH